MTQGFGYYDAGKRFLDLGVALVALVGLSPLLLLVAFLVRRSLGPPVIFRQTRVGHHGRLFTIFKFRTMRDDVDSYGNPLDDRERLTAFGLRLRSTSLDELPELLNIVQGDMSFVGPRPLLPEYLPLYTREEARRHEVRPGLTGWAQTNGRNATTWAERLNQDVWYVDNRSFLLDLRILLKTVTLVLSGSGVAQEGQETMERFRGSSS